MKLGVFVFFVGLSFADKSDQVPPKFVVNLDEPADRRWVHVAEEYKDFAADVSKILR